MPFFNDNTKLFFYIWICITPS
uniref:Uncharacterized protein n=1 Tax=Rhizophora mucronata TaxID=61149 RepID=A0A2P2QI32_RHIMU